ncbi:MAG: hypothetical protein M3487_01660, partial [Actinomycetota bacterium]|nr:hypothetical protein [Actinomycetota bacterium]
LLGAIDVLLPGERNTLRGPATDLADELSRLEVVSDDIDLSAVGGLDVKIEDEQVATEETGVDDIVGLRLSGRASAALDGDDLPIGDLVLESTGAEPSELDVEEAESTEFEFPMVAVEDDGRWYVSLFHTAAEQLRQQSTDEEIPAQGVTPTGGDSPEDAFDAFIGGIETLDLEAIIASLNPDEFQALQRYAPLFLDEAQAELDALDAQLSIDEPAYDVTGDGDTRSISISAVKATVTVDGETADVAFEDGCLRVTPPEGEGEPFDTCELTEDASTMDEIFGEESEELQSFIEELRAAFGDYVNPGFIVKQVDGSWYLSPMATLSEQVLAVIRAFDREEIESIVEMSSELFDDFITGVPGVAPFPDEFLDDDEAFPDITIPDITVPDLTIPDLTVPDLTFPDDSGPPLTIPDFTTPDDSEAAATCFAAETGTDAAACYDALVQTGEISPSTVPVVLRAPQCGLADLYWSGELYSLADADFIAAVEPAAPCFQALVADGTLGEFDLPLELSHPQCLEGRNWYLASDDEAYFDRLLECAYG